MPTTFEACSVGEEVPDTPFEGRVQGVFDAAVNAFDAHGRMVSIMAPGSFAIPHGVHLDAGAPRSMRELGVSEGDSVLIGGERVLEIRHALGPPTPFLEIALWQAPTKRLRVTELGVDLSDVHQARAWATAWAALRGHAPSGTLAAWFGRADPGHGPLDLTYLRRAGSALRDLLAAGRGLDGEAARRPVRRLVGLGAGLTPAGDDLLVGLMSGLLASAGGGERRDAFARDLARALHAATGATTPASAAWLDAAVKGHTSEPMLGVAGSVGSGAHEAARDAVVQAVSVGHSSGSEGVLGLLAGLDTFARGGAASACRWHGVTPCHRCDPCGPGREDAA